MPRPSGVLRSRFIGSVAACVGVSVAVGVSVSVGVREAVGDTVAVVASAAVAVWVGVPEGCTPAVALKVGAIPVSLF